MIISRKFAKTAIHIGFVQELRSKFMGDIIDITQSKGKPVQSLPYFNYFEKDDLYKNLNF